jgi:antitoxin YefM
MESIDVKNITPLTNFRNNISKYLKEINTHKKPIVLTQNGKSAAVLMDAGKYQELQDQIEFMRRVALGLEDYKNRRLVPASEVFREVDALLSSAERK